MRALERRDRLPVQIAKLRIRAENELIAKSLLFHVAGNGCRHFGNCAEFIHRCNFGASQFDELPEQVASRRCLWMDTHIVCRLNLRSGIASRIANLGQDRIA